MPQRAAVIARQRLTDEKMLDKAKKIVLSLSIIVLFALYSFRAKQHDPQNPPPVVAQGVATRTVAAAKVEPTVTPTATQPAPTATVASSQNNLMLAPTEIPTPTATAPAETAVVSTAAAASGSYRNGTYTGPETDANWGEVKVQVVISDGRISDVQFLDYPSDRSRSRSINSQAVPQLTQEAIAAQQANVDVVTGATDTSEAFIESLTAALHQASA